MGSLLEQLGGRDAVEVVVAGFYQRVLSDEKLQPFFRGVSMSRLHERQVDFFCAALAADPSLYRGRDMVTAHAGLQIGDAEFDAVGAHLVDTLQAAGVAALVIDQVVGLIAPLRSQVVGR